MAVMTRNRHRATSVVEPREAQHSEQEDGRDEDYEEEDDDDDEEYRPDTPHTSHSATDTARSTSKPLVSSSPTRPRRIRKRNPALAAIPRPPNAWILYRSEKIRQLSADQSTSTSHQSQVSKTVAELWHAEPPDVKDRFYAQAAAKAEEHRAAHPEYVYKPRETEKAKKAKELRQSSRNSSGAEQVVGTRASRSNKAAPSVIGWRSGSRTAENDRGEDEGALIQGRVARRRKMSSHRSSILSLDTQLPPSSRSAHQPYPPTSPRSPRARRSGSISTNWPHDPYGLPFGSTPTATCHEQCDVDMQGPMDVTVESTKGVVVPFAVGPPPNSASALVSTGSPARYHLPYRRQSQQLKPSLPTSPLPSAGPPASMSPKASASTPNWLWQSMLASTPQEGGNLQSPHANKSCLPPAPVDSTVTSLSTPTVPSTLSEDPCLGVLEEPNKGLDPFEESRFQTRLDVPTPLPACSSSLSGWNDTGLIASMRWTVPDCNALAFEAVGAFAPDADYLPGAALSIEAAEREAALLLLLDADVQRTNGIGLDDDLAEHQRRPTIAQNLRESSSSPAKQPLSQQESDSQDWLARLRDLETEMMQASTAVTTTAAPVPLSLRTDSSATVTPNFSRPLHTGAGGGLASEARSRAMSQDDPPITLASTLTACTTPNSRNGAATEPGTNAGVSPTSSFLDGLCREYVSTPVGMPGHEGVEQEQQDWEATLLGWYASTDDAELQADESADSFGLSDVQLAGEIGHSANHSDTSMSPPRNATIGTQDSSTLAPASPRGSYSTLASDPASSLRLGPTPSAQRDQMSPRKHRPSGPRPPNSALTLPPTGPLPPPPPARTTRIPVFSDSHTGRVGVGICSHSPRQTRATPERAPTLEDFTEEQLLQRLSEIRQQTRNHTEVT